MLFYIRFFFIIFFVLKNKQNRKHSRYHRQPYYWRLKQMSVNLTLSCNMGEILNTTGVDHTVSVYYHKRLLLKKHSQSQKMCLHSMWQEMNRTSYDSNVGSLPPGSLNMLMLLRLFDKKCVAYNSLAFHSSRAIFCAL